MSRGIRTQYIAPYRTGVFAPAVTVGGLAVDVKMPLPVLVLEIVRLVPDSPMEGLAEDPEVCGGAAGLEMDEAGGAVVVGELPGLGAGTIASIFTPAEVTQSEGTASGPPETNCMAAH
jgi:hypothetical protein